MKYASSKTSKERRVVRRRGLILIVSCLVVIFSAVLAMNLERPSLASKAPLTNMTSAGAGGVSAVAVRANLTAADPFESGQPDNRS